MTKKTWIKVKCGILEPKHIAKLGQAWYLYLYILDNANWDTGIISEWKDEYGVQDLGKPLGMIREHRKQLIKEGYISCTKNQHSQTVTIHNWTNPRTYDGIVQNQSYDKDELKETESLPQSNGESVLDQACFDVPSSNHITHNTLKEVQPPEPEYVDDIKEKRTSNYKPLVTAIASVCRMDLKVKTQAGQVGKAAKELDVAGYTPEQVYDFLDWWKKFDWRWTKEHRVPAPHELLTNISKTVEEKKPEVTDEYLRSIGYK